MNIRMPIENIIEHISNSIGATLEQKIKEALMLHTEKVVEEVATQLCHNLKTRIESYSEDYNRNVIVTLRIDGVQKEV